MKAAVEELDSFSGHADHSELLDYFGVMTGSRRKIWLVHGEQDTVLDSRETEFAAKRFEEVGVPVEMHILPGLPHSIDQRGLDIGVEFLRRVLG